MRILPLHREITTYLKERDLEKKFEKQKKLFESNSFHPSLETELLKPKHMKIWSFRIDKKYRSVFIFRDKQTAEVLDINNHYQ